MTKPANMTDRELQSLRNEGHDEVADEIEHLTIDLQTERAAVVALQAEIAALRKSASLRVQFHAAELADVTAELANARAIDIHSCHDGCTRAGCVAAGLREEAEGLREDAERFIALAEAMIADDDTQDTILDLLTAANPDPQTIDEVRDAIDAARRVEP